MSRLISSVFQIRQDPRLLKLPPYISLGCMVTGVAWLLLLPLDNYSRRTYISENALLPGQVHTYFSGSDQYIFRAYKHEVKSLIGQDNYAINDGIEKITRDIGLKTARQNFTYTTSGATYTGENLYAILQAPRGDATEALVLIASWEAGDGQLNAHGVPLALTLARYFKRWSLWSKDIIILFPPEPIMGTQAWVDAYHDAHDTSTIGPLPIKSGLLQGALALDYSQEEYFQSLHITYDGVNGQLPNLDLINSVASISHHQMQFQSNIQRMWDHDDDYIDRLKTMFRGMVNQGLGHATGPHSAFIPYHVDAVTLKPYGHGWQDEMAMGRVVEATFRSLNNLLEHLHQSFFFYLLMNRDRFVSIGTYLPSAMILAANFTIMAIAGWIKSGQPDSSISKASAAKEIRKAKKASSKDQEDGNESDCSLGPLAPPAKSGSEEDSLPDTTERDVALPLIIVISLHALGLIPFYLFNILSINSLGVAFYAFAALNCALPFILSALISTYDPTSQHLHLIKSFSLLGLGMFLAGLATMNFSLAFFVGLFSSPFSFATPLGPKLPTMLLLSAFFNLISPVSIIFMVSILCGGSVEELLQQAASGWSISGVYTGVVAWGIWWPAWLAASLVVLGSPRIAGH